ncbi:MAG: Mov34/MPN/PAD-1 family protein [Gemmatimonadota bacterium]
MKPATDLDLAAEARRRMLLDAARAYPSEACGALLGHGNRVSRVHPLPNRASEPRRSFAIEPRDLEPLLTREAEGGLPVIGFYHSHPDSEPRPSMRDLELALPGYWYVVVGIDHGVPGPPHAWRLDG